MSQINIQNLTFAYEGSTEKVFDSLNLTIDTSWRTGLIGRNGRGKTTLLKLLAGKYAYSGKIDTKEFFSVFPPIKPPPPNLCALDAVKVLCPSAADWEIEKELSLIGVKSDAFYRDIGTLSGGERTKLFLAALFLCDIGFPLIDEPTNSLDSSSREKVADYLGTKNGFILVSHDRNFLDRCVDHIISINKTGFEVQSGNFSSWFENFKNREEYEKRENRRLENEIKHLNEAAAKSAGWAEQTEKSKIRSDADFKDTGYIGHKAAKMMKRAKNAARRNERAAEEKSLLLKNTEKSESLKISPLVFRNEKIITLDKAEIFYGERKICAPISFSVSRGERIALDGANGSGKSSILKLIEGKEIAYRGKAEIPSGLKISVVPQSTEGLYGSLSDFAKDAGIDESLFKAILRKMDFPRETFANNISDFSEGQKKKVLIAKSLCEKAHIYIWDEPLNFIDIYSRMQIENLILEFSPTMIFVEHDRTFRNKIATSTVEL